MRYKDDEFADFYYEEWHKVDANDAYMNGAFDELGNGVTCSFCDGELRFDEEENVWRCLECTQTISRAQWFNDIGAKRVPGKKCLTQCHGNYPICKNWCFVYKIKENDPIIT